MAPGSGTAAVAISGVRAWLAGIEGVLASTSSLAKELTGAAAAAAGASERVRISSSVVDSARERS